MLNKKKINDILKFVALRDGVSVEHVRSEIQKAILLGMNNPDPAVKSYWNNIPHDGNCPTPEDVILYMGRQFDNA